MKVQPELAGKTIYSVCRMNDGFLLGTSEGVYSIMYATKT